MYSKMYIRSLQPLDYKKFDVNITEFINENSIESTSNYIVVTSTKNRFTYVYGKKDSFWELLYKWSCTVGKEATPTIVGIFNVGMKYPAIGDNNSSVKYAINITGEYYYHSILYDAKGLNIKDERLGEAISHGCIRLATSSAKWFFDNIPVGSTIIIK